MPRRSHSHAERYITARELHETLRQQQLAGAIERATPSQWLVLLCQLSMDRQCLADGLGIDREMLRLYATRSQAIPAKLVPALLTLVTEACQMYKLAELHDLPDEVRHIRDRWVSQVMCQPEPSTRSEILQACGRLTSFILQEHRTRSDYIQAEYVIQALSKHLGLLRREEDPTENEGA